MERKANTYLLRDDAFLTSTCQNLVISPNEGGRISHSAVSEKTGPWRVLDFGNCAESKRDRSRLFYVREQGPRMVKKVVE